MRMRSRGTGNLKNASFAALAAALAVAAPVLGQQPQLSSIRVTGEGRVTTRPDRAQIDIGVTTHAATSQEAAADNARRLEAVLAALRSAAGPAVVLKTVGYALHPDYHYHPNGAAPTLEGYTAANIVQVTLDELGRIGSIIDAATRAGANQVQGIQFTLRDPDAVRATALREAAARARAAADVLAAALGLKVLRVLTVEESSPRISPVRWLSRSAAPAAVETPVEPGTLESGAEVVLTVEVAPAAR
jgi:uncharacterized protein